MTVAAKELWTCDLCHHTEDYTVTTRGWPEGWRRFRLTELGPNPYFRDDHNFDVCPKCVVPYKTMAPIRRLLGMLNFFRRD